MFAVVVEEGLKVAVREVENSALTMENPVVKQAGAIFADREYAEQFKEFIAKELEKAKAIATEAIEIPE